MSEGMVSGLRRRAGELEAVQTTAPISPGSSGGGLFDAEGRLIGITTWALRDSQNLNFAIPAKWIGEVATRSQERLARRNAPTATPLAEAASSPAPVTPAPPTVVAARTPPVAAVPSAPDLLTRPLRAGDTFEYRVTDRSSRNASTVVMRVDQADDAQAVFNAGARVETQTGELVRLTSALLGEMDRATPPGGWMPGGAAQRGSRRVEFASPDGRFLYKLEAYASAPQKLTTAVGEVQAVRIDLDGWVQNTIMPSYVIMGRYRATLWLAPELRRVVRFEAVARSGSNTNSTQINIDESVELVRIGSRR